MRPRPLIFVLALSLPGLCLPQTVYESNSGQGKVYSDRPMPGSKAVELRPLNVAEPVPVPPAAAERPAESAVRRPEAVSPGYRTLRVLFPEEGGSVPSNEATFEVRLTVEPALAIERGHAFALRLDGRPVPGRFTATEIMVPPEFFGYEQPAGVQRHVLEASIVDGGGRVLLSAPPVDFQTRFVNVLQRPHGMRPRPQPLPQPVPPASPKPPPTLEQAPPRPDGRKIDR